MNKPSATHKPKGISVDGFWRQLKDKTETKDSGPNAVNRRDLPEANIKFRKSPDPIDNWESRAGDREAKFARAAKKYLKLWLSP